MNDDIKSIDLNWLENHIAGTDHTIEDISTPFPYEEVYEDLDGTEPTMSYDNEQAVMKFFRQLTSFILAPTNNKKKSQRIISIRYLAAVYCLLKKEYQIPNGSAFLRLCNIKNVSAVDFLNVCRRMRRHFDKLNKLNTQDK